jgi:predicted naringenin-chalcone synthase
VIGDENLQNSHDYSEGQKKAAFRVLVELCSLFEQYRDDIRITGG